MGVNGYGHSRNTSSSGTCARTRPFSFAEIMLRRKTKNILADVKEGASDARGMLGISESAYEKSVSDDILMLIKGSSKNAEGGAPRKKEKIEMDKSDDHLQHGYKYGHNLSNETEVKCGYDKSNGEKRKKSYRSRKDDKEKIEFPKDPKKKQSENSHVNDRDLNKDEKFEREGEKIHQARKESKSKPEEGRFILNKRRLNKLSDFERSRGHESRKSKSRRSRSRETYHKRDKSVSLSPRPRKKSYHGESSSSHYKDKSERMYYDPKKGRTSQTGGHEKRHQKHHRMGGYSPRKRRNGVVISPMQKSSSPKVHSPNKKFANWDQPPSGSLPANIHSTSNNQEEFPSSPDITNVSKAQQVSLLKTPVTVSDSSADAIELTQATRPMRSLYVENVPPSTSDKAIIEWLNSNFLSPGSVPVQKSPCISCIINREKCHAVVEFLTAEDATTALSFHGKVFFGSVLKMRRPKDFIETPIGTKSTNDKSSLIAAEEIQTSHAISDVVKDSAHKIFIGGISKSLSAAMLMDIVTAFGPLKSYHFEINEELNEPCAFLEYMDKSITLKALTGLNGLKLGGQVLIAVKTLLNIHLDENRHEENLDNLATYTIPEHARPLLRSPTRILKLKNVFVPEEFMLLSESELEETLEDIRLECARFGTVKSINVVRCRSVVCDTVDETLKIESKDTENEQATPGIDSDSGLQSDLQIVDDNVLEKLSSDYCSPSRTDISEEHPETNDSNTFEPGSILVEFLREEAALMSVCCLNGRLYGDHVVSTSYASYDDYKSRF